MCVDLWCSFQITELYVRFFSPCNLIVEKNVQTQQIHPHATAGAAALNYDDGNISAESMKSYPLFTVYMTPSVYKVFVQLFVKACTYILIIRSWRIMFA